MLLLLVTQPVMMVIFSPIAGRISDRIKAQILAAIGTAFCCIGLVLYVFVDETTTLWFIVTGLVMIGFGNGLFSFPNINAIMGSVEKKYFGIASGASSTVRTTGMMLSMGIAMILLSIFVGDNQIVPSYYPNFLSSIKVGFIVFAVICFGSIFAQLAGSDPKQR